MEKEELEARLRRAVEKEDYEEAAAIRDAIEKGEHLQDAPRPNSGLYTICVANDDSGCLVNAFSHVDRMLTKSMSAPFDVVIDSIVAWHKSGVKIYMVLIEGHPEWMAQAARRRLREEGIPVSPSESWMNKPAFQDMLGDMVSDGAKERASQRNATKVANALESIIERLAMADEIGFEKRIHVLEFPGMPWVHQYILNGRPILHVDYSPINNNVNAEIIIKDLTQ